METVPVTIVVVLGSVIAWGLIRLSLKARAAQQSALLVGKALNVWASLGPFDNGWESAEAMRCALIATGVRPDRESLRSHAESYDADPNQWEKTRRSGLETVPPAAYLERARRIMSREAPPIGLAWLAPERTQRPLIALRRKLSGAFRPAAFGQLISDAAERARADGQVPEGADGSRYDPRLFDARKWRDDFSERVTAISRLASGSEQRLGLRNLIVEAVSQMALAEFFLSPKHDVEEACLATRGIASLDGKSGEELDVTCSTLWRSAQATMVACRHIASALFNDASDNDYLRQLLQVSRVYYQQTLDVKVSRARRETYVFEALIPTVEQLYEQTCETILAGGNYDTSDLVEQRTEDENKPKTEARERLDVITPEQVDALYRLVQDRLARLADGKLYHVEGFPSAGVAETVKLDTALMLISLSECVSDVATAEAAVREVIFRFLTSLDISPEDRTQVRSEEIPLDEQHVFLELWDEHRDDGPLPGVMLMGAAMLFCIEPDKYQTFSRDDHDAFARLAVHLLDNAWEVIRETKVLVGRSDEAKRFEREVSWSSKPGARERHLRRRHQNPLFSPARRFVTQVDINSARMADERDVAEFSREVAVFLSDLQHLPDAIPPQEVKPLRERLDDLTTRAMGYGETGYGHAAQLRTIRNQLIDAWRESFKHRPDLVEALKQAEDFHHAGSAKFGRPFVAEMQRPDKPIPTDEILPALLSEDPETIALVLCDVWPNEAVQKQIQAQAVKLLRKAHEGGMGVEEYASKLRALGVLPAGSQSA